MPNCHLTGAEWDVKLFYFSVSVLVKADLSARNGLFALHELI